MRDWLSRIAASRSPTRSGILTAPLIRNILEHAFYILGIVPRTCLSCQEMSKFSGTATSPYPESFYAILYICLIVNDQANDPVFTSPARLKVAIITPRDED